MNISVKHTAILTAVAAATGFLSHPFVVAAVENKKNVELRSEVERLTERLSLSEINLTHDREASDRLRTMIKDLQVRLEVAGITESSVEPLDYELVCRDYVAEYFSDRAPEYCEDRDSYQDPEPPDPEY